MTKKRNITKWRKKANKKIMMYYQRKRQKIQTRNKILENAIEKKNRKCFGNSNIEKIGQK